MGNGIEVASGEDWDFPTAGVLSTKRLLANDNLANPSPRINRLAEYQGGGHGPLRPTPLHRS